MLNPGSGPAQLHIVVECHRMRYWTWRRGVFVGRAARGVNILKPGRSSRIGPQYVALLTLVDRWDCGIHRGFGAEDATAPGIAERWPAAKARRGYTTG